MDITKKLLEKEKQFELTKKENEFHRIPVNRTPLILEPPKEMKPAPLIAIKVTVEDEKGVTKEINKE